MYLDSSAIVKLVVAEHESDALRSGLGPDIASSALARIEVVRAVRRSEGDRLTPAAEAVLEALDLVAVDAGILRAAAVFDPPSVRTLDAIHLATAAEFGNDLEVLITYDERMAVAASDAGFDTWAPAPP